jgi:hypothetical protein
VISLNGGLRALAEFPKSRPGRSHGNSTQRRRCTDKPHCSIALSLRERVGVRGCSHRHAEGNVWRWLRGRQPGTRSSSTMVEPGSTSCVIDGNTDFVCPNNAVGRLVPKHKLTLDLADHCQRRSDRRRSSVGRNRSVNGSGPSPRPSPGGRGRSSGETCACIFYAEWIARWLQKRPFKKFRSHRAGGAP